MTADPLAFLHATLDAAQARAEAAAERAWSGDWEYDDMVHEVRDLFNANTLAFVPHPEIGNHIVANSPAAVLRRIAADRKLIAAHPHTTRVINPTCGLPSAGFGCDNCHNWDGVPEGRGYCDTILALAEGWGWTGETT